MRIAAIAGLCLALTILALPVAALAGDGPDFTCDTCIDVDDAISPTMVWQTVAGSTVGEPNNEYAYSFCGLGGGEYTFSTCESTPGSATYDTALSIWANAGGTCGAQQACNDDDCSGGASFLHSTITWICPADGDYVIVVDGFSSSTGDYVLAYMGPECGVPVEPSNWGSIKAVYR